MIDAKVTYRSGLVHRLPRSQSLHAALTPSDSLREYTPLVSMIRAAIFDLDGTLVDSLPATVDAFNAVVAPFLGTRLTAKEVRGVAGPNYRKILGNFLPADRVDAGLKQ